MNELYLIIALVGIIIIGILWLIYYKHKNKLKPKVVKTKNKSSNTSTNNSNGNSANSEYKIANEVIKNDWDGAIDLIATIHFKNPIGGDKLQNILYSDLYHNKVNIHGMFQNKDHCKLNNNQEYYGLYFSIPLASKYQSLNGMEYSYFVQYVQRVAIYFDGDVDIPSMADTLTKAQNIKTIAADACQYLQFKILLQKPTDTESLIEYFKQQNNLQFIAANQCLYCQNEHNIYTIEWPQEEFTQVLYFYYTPSIIPKDIDGLAIMSKGIEELLNKWSAVVCTPDNQVLTYEMYEQINKNIQNLHLTLEQHNLSAGSAAIKRLISYT